MSDAEKPEQDKSGDTPAGSTPAAPATTATTAPAASKEPEPAKPSRADRRRGAATTVKNTTSSLRNKLASLVWLVAVVCALFLAVGALLVALQANQDNAIVKFVLDGADTLDLDVFSREEGIFTFDKDKNGTKATLVNWGIAAMAYLVVGKVLDRIIRP